MDKVTVVFSSITSATGVRKHLLRKYNIQSVLRQTPRNLYVSGCSYCLVVDSDAVDIVKKVAFENSLMIKGIFTEDGTRI